MPENAENEASGAPGPDEQYCSSCGEIIKEDAEICPECGVRQRDSQGEGDLDVVETLSNGFSRTTRQSGLILIGLYVVLNFVNSATSFSLLNAIFERLGPDAVSGGMTQEMNPFMGQTAVPGGVTLPLPLPVLVVLTIALAVLGVYLSLVTARVMASEHEVSIPQSFYRRNALQGVANLIVAGIVTSLAVGIGLLLLVIPGLFLMVSFALVQVIVSVEDVNFLEAISESWEMVKGNRLEVFLIGFGIFVVSIVVSIVAMVFSFTPVLNQLVSSITQAFMVVFVTGVLADVYLQLGGEPIES